MHTQTLTHSCFAPQGDHLLMADHFSHLVLTFLTPQGSQASERCVELKERTESHRGRQCLDRPEEFSGWPLNRRKHTLWEDKGGISGEKSSSLYLHSL